MKLTHLRILVVVAALFHFAIAPARSAEVILDLSGAEVGPGKEIHLNSGLQRLPASAAYEFEFAGSMRGTGFLATVVPAGTTFQDLADMFGSGVTIPSSGVVANPTGKLPFAVIKRSFSGGVPIPGLPANTDVNLAVKIRGGVAADGRVFFDMTGLDVQIPGFDLLGNVKLENGSKLTIRSLFEQFAGVYCGHVSGSVFSINNQGIAKVTVTQGGLITGQIQVGKRIFRIKSGLDQNRVTPEVLLGTTGLRVKVSADVAKRGVVTLALLSQAGEIGSVELARGSYIDGPPTPRAGIYTALLNPPPLQGGDTPSTKPAAPGCLKIKITASGLVSYAGRLCDGSVFIGNSLVTGGDEFALFASLTSGFGGIYGDVTLLPETDPDDLGGSLRWLKPAFPTEKVFALGVDVMLDVQGSRYIRADIGQRALLITDGTVNLTAGNLPAAASISVQLTQNNKFIAPASLVLTLNPLTGALTGTYKPAGAKIVKLAGVILQKQGIGGGSFLPSASGALAVEPGAMALRPSP